MSKINENKKQKEQTLYNTAFKLFTTKGVQNTAINDIVREAGIAKGTFYLYFKDKYDILDKLIIRKTSILIKEAVEKTQLKTFENSIDQLLEIINYIVEYLSGNKLLLKMIYKNLSWGIYRKLLYDPDPAYHNHSLFQNFLQIIEQENLPIENPEITLFLILELTGSVCYSSIILQEPAPIEIMKPHLFDAIRKLLKGANLQEQ